MNIQNIKAKPFLKWAGGKGQLLNQIEAHFPQEIENWQKLTYVEPFVGGGAMLFHMLQTFPNIKKAVINDINKDLISAYLSVRDSVEQLIKELKKIEEKYYSLQTEEDQKTYFLSMRERFNEKKMTRVKKTSLLIFLNKTCFNGLYRVNKAGKFNVPFGKYKRPKICNEKNLLSVSTLLQKVEIVSGDFEKTYKYINEPTFFYIDPPYRPLSKTSSFNTYAKEPFNDEEQKRLKEYCDKLNQSNVVFMLSNSDPKGTNAEDSFFDDLYSTYDINRVWASRSVNSNPEKRGKLREILVCNFSQNGKLTDNK